MNPVNAHHASLLWVGGRLVLSLIVVLVLFMGAVWLLRFLQKRSRSSRSGPGTLIEIRTTCALAPKTSLSVVAVGDEAFLIGVTPQGVSLLARLGGKSRPKTRETVEERAIQETVRSEVPAGRNPMPRQVAASAIPEPVKAPEESFESLVIEALNKIKEGRMNRESPGGVRRWSV